MIQVIDLTARGRGGRGSPRVDLGPVSFSAQGPTSLALLGSRADGVDLMLDCLAGAAPPKRGSVTGAGAGAVAARGRTVAHVPHVPDLPEVLTVEAYLALAAEVRAEAATKAPRERLGAFGLASLAARRIDTLPLEQARAVAIVEALTSRATFICLAEPLADLDPRAVGRVTDAIQARVAAGATVVFSTASAATARALGREQLHFTRGKLTLRTTGDEPWQPVVGSRGARLIIRSEGARLLLAELSADPTFSTVHGVGAELVVTGKDPVAMASAVAIATRHANVELDVLEFDRNPEQDSAP